MYMHTKLSYKLIELKQLVAHAFNLVQNLHVWKHLLKDICRALYFKHKFCSTLEEVRKGVLLQKAETDIIIIHWHVKKLELTPYVLAEMGLFVLKQFRQDQRFNFYPYEKATNVGQQYVFVNISTIFYCRVEAHICKWHLKGWSRLT